MAKDPKRVAAGKKAAKSRKKKSSGGGGKPKRPSLSGMAIIGGAAMIITGIGADAYANLVGGLNTMADDVGLGMTITGSTIVTGTVALKLVASFWKGFGRRYRAFLAGFGLRP
jgi:hypothetical protein